VKQQGHRNGLENIILFGILDVKILWPSSDDI
jgi:hypothetical protein